MYSNCGMFNKLVIIISVLLLSAVNSGYSNAYAQVNAPVKSAVKNAVSVSPVEVVNCPAEYLNKIITFEADFVSYSALGLDYKPAFREGAKYIGILIKRNDVNDHVIPLSEMKLFIKREIAEKYADLENGDRVKITGRVFSTALGDPWVDITDFSIIKKYNKDNNSK